MLAPPPSKAGRVQSPRASLAGGPVSGRDDRSCLICGCVRASRPERAPGRPTGSGAEGPSTYFGHVSFEPIQRGLEVIDRVQGLQEQLASDRRHRETTILRKRSQLADLLVVEPDLQGLGPVVTTGHLHPGARLKRGCLSFIESVHEADSNEVYDAGNSLAMERLKFAEATEAPNGNSTSPSPYPWTDCNAFRPGDPLDFSDTQCNYEVVQFFTVDCVNGTYVHLSRPQLGDLEGIDGVTPWREAAPVDPKRRLTDWAFENCKEHG